MWFKSIVRTSVFLLLFYIVMAGFAFAQGTKELRVGIMHFPPFADMSDLRKPTGVFVEMITSSLTEAGIAHSKVKGYPPKRHYSNLGSGATQFSIGSKNVPYYHDSVIFSKFSVMTIQCYVLSLPGKQVLPADPKQWKGSFLLMTGYGYGTLRKGLEKIQKTGQLKIIDAPKHVNLFKMLKAGRGDYAVDYAGPTEQALEVVKIPNLQKKVVFAVDVYFLLNKNVPNASEKMKQVEAAYESLKRSGKFKS